MSRPLRILLTNITLATRTGTELWIKEAALGLLRRGHMPMVYTPDPGVIAEEIRAATVPVVDDLSRLGVRPDVIHGHHHQPTMAALLHFPGVPALFVSHDWMSWNDQPPCFPRILRYVAVDATNRDRLVVENGIPEERVRVLLNWVDLERFRPRAPLPERPRRALVFSNYARDVTTLPAIREACRRAGLELDVAGEGSGRLLARPEEVLGEYDLVFAKARAALEALAVGAAVVLCDVRGLGPLVTRADLDALRLLNLGVRALRDPVTPDGLLREIQRYDSRDAAEVSRRVRETAGMEPALDRLVALYGEVVAEGEGAAPWDPVEETRSVAVYLQRWTTGTQRELQALRADRDRLQNEQIRLLDGLDRSQNDLDRSQNDLNQAQDDLDRSQNDRLRLQNDLAFLLGSATWRLRERLLRLTGLRRLYRGIGSLFGRPPRLP